MPNDIRLAVLDTKPIRDWSYPRILVGIPLERAVSYADQVFFRFMDIAAQGPELIRLPYSRIDITRNIFAEQLLASNYTHLIMLDLDHKHPIDIIQRLAKWVILDPDILVVSGLNFRRGKPFEPVCGVLNEAGEREVFLEWEEGLVEVDECGGASMLISRTVFERLQPPWFFNVYDKVWENRFPGEDMGFSQKCREAGITMYVDTTVSSPHCIESLVTEQTFRNYIKLHPEEFHETV